MADLLKQALAKADNNLKGTGKGAKDSVATRINGVLFPPAKDGIGLILARESLRAKNLQLAKGTKSVSGEVHIEISPGVIVEALKARRKIKALLEDLNTWEALLDEQLEREKILENEIERLQKELSDHHSQLNDIQINQPPQSDTVFEINNIDGTITYGKLWNILLDGPHTNIYVNTVLGRTQTEQVKTLQTLHGLCIPLAIKKSSTIFKFTGTLGSDDQEVSDKITGELKKGSLEQVSISWLIGSTENNTNARKNVIRYCLLCYAAGVQLKP